METTRGIPLFSPHNFFSRAQDQHQGNKPVTKYSTMGFFLLITLKIPSRAHRPHTGFLCYVLAQVQLSDEPQKRKCFMMELLTQQRASPHNGAVSGGPVHPYPHPHSQPSPAREAFLPLKAAFCVSHPDGLLPARLFAVLWRLLLFPTSDGIYLHVIICSGSFDLHIPCNCSVVTLWTTTKYQFRALAENILIPNPNKKVLIGLLVILSRSHNRFLYLFTTTVFPPHPSKSALDLINLGKLVVSQLAI